MKSLKRNFIFMLIITLLLGYFSVDRYAFANNYPTVSIENIQAVPGDIVELDITISNNPGIIAMLLKINYDSDKLKLLGAFNGDVMSNSTYLCGNNLSMTPFTLMWEDALAPNNIKSDGKMATLKFEVLATAPEAKADIILIIDNGSTFNYDLNEVNFTPVNGSIFIGENTSETETTIKPEPSDTTNPTSIENDTKIILQNSSKYNIDYENNFITNVAANTTVAALLSQIENGNVKIKDINGNILDDNVIIGTAFKAVLYDENGEELTTYIIAVIGDLNGDGLIKPTDARIALRGAVKIATLTDVYFHAANVNKTEKLNVSSARRILRVAVKIEEF